MREIKFQIYWIAGHEMLYDTNNDLEFRDKENYWITDLSDATNHPESYKVRQYTGLKDKNGLEIYEGDIINCHIVTPKKNWKELKKVEYDEDMARFAAVSLDGNHWSSLPSNVAFNLNPVRIDKCEVIGNRYENPELLKEEPTC
jgi:uncharacterized phage protein (TIGR01671 family)